MTVIVAITKANMNQQNEEAPINWKQGKERFGRIRRNQVWQKRDTSKKMTIKGPVKNNGWHVIFEGESRGMRCHTIKEHDIYRFYLLLE